MISRNRSLLMLLTAALCLLSCTKQELPEEGQFSSNPVSDIIEYHINASCVETRTAVDGSSIVWSTGDKIAVAYNHNKARQTAVFEYEGDNSFATEILTPDDPSDWYAIYPSSAAGTSASSINIPAESVQQGNGSKAHLAGDGFPLWGKALGIAGGDTPHLQMEQIATVINFNISNQEDSPIKVNKIIFTAPVEIAGEFSGSMTSGSKWTPTDGKATKTAVLDVEDCEEIASGTSASFYMGTMPFSATGDFTITVMAECDGEQIYSTKNVGGKTMEFKAGVIGKINYKFVNSLSETAKSYYVKVTSDPGAQKWSGQYLIVNTENKYAFSTLNGTANKFGVTVQEDRIESTAEVDRHSVTVSGGISKHSKSDSDAYAYDIKNSEGKYIYQNSGGFHVSDTNLGNGGTYQSTFTLIESSVQLMCGKNGGSGGSSYYLTYSGSSFEYNTTSSNRVLLYRKDDGNSKPEQNLNFAENRIVWNVGEDGEFEVGGTYNLPQSVSGARTFVTYTSSNAAVAEIVANSQIKINGTGTTTITATAAESDEYKGASASYTLTINDSSSVPETYLGSFNLESNALTQYLDATTKYTDDNWSTVTVINNSTFSKMCGVGGEGYDFPTPVTVKWTGNNKQSVTVSIYTDSSRSQASLDQTATSTSTSVKFYNLIPGRTYYYTVTLSGGAEIDRGYFNTTGRRRQLKTTDTVSEDNATNVRDLGGMVTTDGKTLNFGLVYRGSNMRKIGNTEKAVIRDYMKVRLDVDLRRDDEYNVTATSVFPESEVAYSHVAYDGTSMTDFLNKSKVNKTFTDIINYVSQGKAVYIHCKSGADRTGYVCMLIEAVCGVSLADCTRDYEITSFSKAGSRDRCGYTSNYLITYAMEHILSAKGDTFQEKAINILKTDGGITDAQITALQNALIQQ